MMGLGQHFRKMDQSGDGLLDRRELHQALETYHIKIPEEVKSKCVFFLSQCAKINSFYF